MKREPLQKIMLEQFNINRQNNNLYQVSHLVHKLSKKKKRIMNTNIKCKNFTKPHRKKFSRSSKNYHTWHTKHDLQKKKMRKFDFINTKNMYSIRVFVKRINRQVKDWEKIFSNYRSKILLSKIYHKLSKLNWRKKQMTQLKHGQKT